MFAMRTCQAALLAFVATTLYGLTNAQAVGSKDLFRCRQSCYQKFVQDWHHCMDFEDCKNCWNNCDQQLGPFPLNINSALRQGSLVLTDIAWDQAITNASKQCLVTWEVSGGGLMGNLLTDSSTVELSLWPDTVYHVQVTCKHKETGGMRRSYKLIVDTHKLSDSTATGMQAIAMETLGMGKAQMQNIYGNEQAAAASDAASGSEMDSRLRILKDSSKDFLTPYNPNADLAKTTSAKVSATTTTTTTAATAAAKTAPKTTTTKTTSGSVKTSVPPQPARTSSVLRTKLSGGVIPEPAVDLLSQSILLAVVGSVVLFFGLLILYALSRPVQRKELPAECGGGCCAIDKEVLIHSEMLPSQTAAARDVAASAAGTPPPSLATTARGALMASDARTLHV